MKKLLKGLMSVLRWFGRVEGMDNNTIAKRLHVGECKVVIQLVDCGKGGLIQ